jgi:hypothetical protein
MAAPPASSFDRRCLDVAYNAPDAAAAITRSLRENGVVVITGVFPSEFVDAAARALVTALEGLSDGVSHKDLRTWREEQLPPQTRFGLFQSRLGSTAAAWRVRAHPAVRDVFTKVYSGLRGARVEEFVTSIDGVNVRPPVAPFYDADDGADWAHFDLTRDAPDECVQGQAVLTDTTAGFRCSPRSHLIYADVVRDVKGSLGDPSDWCLLPSGMYAGVRARVQALGGAFQIPIIAPKGSMILWLSATLHSAKGQDKPVGAARVRPRVLDPLHNFRVVVYVCYRPQSEVDEAHFARLMDAHRHSLSTCHSGRRVFPRTPRARRGGRVDYSPVFRALMSADGDAAAFTPLDEPMRALLSRTVRGGEEEDAPRAAMGAEGAAPAPAAAL